MEHRGTAALNVKRKWLTNASVSTAGPLTYLAPAAVGRHLGRVTGGRLAQGRPMPPHPMRDCSKEVVMWTKEERG